MIFAGQIATDMNVWCIQIDNSISLISLIAVVKTFVDFFSYKNISKGVLFIFIYTLHYIYMIREKISHYVISYSTHFP